MIWREFKAMGTDIVLFALLEPEQENILNEAELAILDFEKRFSRFVEGNELADFNNYLKPETEVSETLAELLKESNNYFIKTKGIFDPTIIGSLERVGYDKNFLELDPKSERSKHNIIDPDKIQREFRSRSKMGDLRIEKRIIKRPYGFRVDFGGIGKGYIVDVLSQTILRGVENYWFSAGGDIFVSGSQQDGEGWDIGVQNPLKPEENIFYINTRGEKIGIASSGIIMRSGQKGNFKWNHIIDPRFGLPIKNNILSVTVISSNAVKADIYAKTVLILGGYEGLKFIEKESDSACIIFMKNNKPIFSKRAGLYLKNKKQI